MSKMMSIALLPLVLLLVGQTGGTMISVTNGGHLGDWGPLQTCPQGTVAKGFSLKVQKKQLIGLDDTALNGIKVYCVSNNIPYEKTSINSSIGQWGKWGNILWCPYGYLIAFTLREEPYKKWKDNTAATNIQFLCSDGEILKGYGLRLGEYGDWSEKCKFGIAGIQTRVEVDQGRKDNTALNDVKFLCRRLPLIQRDQQGKHELYD